jgi:hypothetical protein
MTLPGAAIFDIAVKIVTIVLALVPLFDPGSSHFEGKAMGVRAVFWPLSTLVIPVVWWSRSRPRPYPYLADVALVTPFLLDAAGNGFGWFAITGFDVIPHLIGWLCLTLAFGLAVAPLVDGRWVAFGLALGFGATIDIAWEIGEYLLQRSGQSGLRLTYANTIQDLAMSLTGSLLGATLVATVLWPRPGTPRALFGWSTAPD